MAFFNKKEGGLMDVIRCDEKEYLIWKWRPTGSTEPTSKENSIRYGSSLRVKDGELAVFVYKQSDGAIQDFIIGPYDGTIKTANFPILTNILGTAFGGDSPFQAEIYFINLSGNIQIKFGVPYFDVFDSRFIDLGIPCAIRGAITFNISDYKNFIKLNRLIEFDIEDYKRQIKDTLIRKIKGVVLNIIQEGNIPIMQLERKIDEISDLVKNKLSSIVEDDFGVNLKRLDISAIELDKQHPHYLQLKSSTADQQSKLSEARTDIEIENLAESMRIQRKDRELGVEGKNINVHQLNQQTEVLKTAAESLGKMGNVDFGGGGMNPVGIMAGMSIGGAMGSQMGGMMNNINQSNPPKIKMYHIAINGQQSGPHSIDNLKQLITAGQFNKDYYVWTEGMAAWEKAESITEVLALFPSVPPAPPTI